jgi:hypothetical protein
MIKWREWALFVSVGIVASPVFGASYIVPPDDVLIRKAHGIVIARATSVWVEESAERGIETVTEFNVEDVLKGEIPATFRIRVPGGKFGKIVKLVPGVPQFVEGEQSLLFINRLPGTDSYITTDFGLGNFKFAYDDRGRHLAVRAEGEIFGWDLGTNLKHQEQRRDADQFMAYIRAIVAGRHEPPDYFVPVRPLLGKTSNATQQKRVVPLACTFPSCTATSYSLANDPMDENSMGLRWNVFPSAVNWNQGNTEPGAPSGGTTAINAAFSAWNGDTSSNVNYVLATSTSNTSGITDAPDGVNNIVFEHNFGSDYVCGSGGLLGAGGIQTTSGTNMVNSETFGSSTEADVSMNKGIANCTSFFNSGDFNSAVTHEVGHTLGIRHADQNRASNAACSTDTNLECASSAIMTATVTSGISATLQAWDQHGVRSMYASGAAPPAVTGVEAHATTAGNVQVVWSGSCSMTCRIYRSRFNDRTTFDLAGSGGGTLFNDSGVSAGRSYLYKVRAFDGSTESVDSNVDLATTVIPTNTLTPTVTVITALDFTEIRSGVNAVQTLAGTANTAYTDNTLDNTVTVKEVHIDEPLTRLNSARTTLGVGTISLTGGSITQFSTPVRASDVTDLRNGFR